LSPKGTQELCHQRKRRGSGPGFAPYFVQSLNDDWTKTKSMLMYVSFACTFVCPLHMIETPCFSLIEL